MKIAISIPDDLFKELTELVRIRKNNRSQLITSAIRDLIKKAKNEQIIESINNAVDSIDSDEDIVFMKHANRHFAKVLKDGKY